MAKRLRVKQIDEVSLVDKGANPDAHIVLYKRDFSDKEREHLASSGAALPDGSFPIENRGDLENAIKAIGRAKDPAKAKAHIIARAKALGATDALPDSWKGKSLGKRMLAAFGAALGWTPEQYEKAAASMDADCDDDAGADPDADEDDTPAKPGKGKNQQPTQKREEQMPDPTKPENAATDNVTKAELAALLERVSKAEAAVEATKAENGALKEQLASEVEKRQTEQYVAKAAKLPGVPGEPAEVARILRAIDTLPAEDAAVVHAALAKMSAAIVEGDLLESVGKSGSVNAPNASAGAEFMRLAQERVTKSAGALALVDAMRDVAKENPALYQQYLETRS